MSLEYNIGQIPFDDKKWKIGIGYAAIPSDVNRDTFITDCIIKGEISFKTKEGGSYHRCKTAKHVFDHIAWPERWQDNGTPIVYVTDELHSEPIIVGALCFNDEILDRQENQFKLRRVLNNSIVEITGDVENESLTIFVNGVQASDLNIKLSNQTDKAVLNIDVDGKYILKTLNEIDIQSQTSIAHRVGETEEKMSSIVQDNSSVGIKAEKFIVNNGNEPIPLGDTLKQFLDDLVDEIAKTTVPTAIGTMRILNTLQVKKFKDRTKEILSQYSWTD